MDAALSNDRAYFDSQGRLQFAFVQSSATATSAVFSEESELSPILTGRQSPLAAVLAAMAVLLFATTAVSAPVLRASSESLATSIDLSASGARVVLAAAAAQSSERVHGASVRLWGVSDAPARLPFAGLASSIQTGPRRGALLVASVGGSVALLHEGRDGLAAIASLPLSPATVFGAVQTAYLSVGQICYQQLTLVMSGYLSSVDRAGAGSYGLGITMRDLLTQVPSYAVSNLASMGGAIVYATHTAILTENSLVYAFVDGSPHLAQTLVETVGTTGLQFERGAGFAAPQVVRGLALFVREPSIAAPASSRATILGTYAVAVQFVQTTSEIQNRYAEGVAQAGDALYGASISATKVRDALPRAAQVAYDTLNTVRLRSASLLSAAFVGSRGITASAP